MPFHKLYPAADSLTVNELESHSTQAASQTTIVYCLSIKFHDSTIDFEFRWI